MKVEGRGGEVEFDGNFIAIRHKGALGRLTVGKGEKRIPLSSITSVQIKPAGALVNGYIQFSLPGGNEKRATFGRQTLDAAEDENSVIFTKAQEPQFIKLRDAIESAMVARSNPQVHVAPQVSSTSKLDELKKLAELRDSGILTEDEFALEKARIMGSDAMPSAASAEQAEDASSEEIPDEGDSAGSKFGLGRIAGIVATGGASEVARFARKKLRDK